MLPSHTLLKQRYLILQSVGKGGMGAVYMAQDVSLGNRPVAVKEMSQGHLPMQEVQSAAENFKREAHMLAGLHHPNLPSIHDHFEESGRWYLVMDFIQGETLEEYLSRSPDQKLPLEEVLQIGQQLCDVLDHLHTYQPPIIFRDLKPSNIMRSAKGHIYLIDFGVARHFKPGQDKDTANYGSAGYSPPEQYGQAQTSERSDIYSLGATLYHLLSGYKPTRSPFRLPPLQSLVPTLPPRLVTLITQMIELDEGRRPASIKVVKQELQQSSTPAPLPITPTPVASVPPPYGVPPVVVTPLSLNPISPNRRVLSIVGMIIGSLLALYGIPIIVSELASAYSYAYDYGYDYNNIGAILLFSGLIIFFIGLNGASSPVPSAQISSTRRNFSIVGIIIGSLLGLVCIPLVIFGYYDAHFAPLGSLILFLGLIILFLGLNGVSPPAPPTHISPNRRALSIVGMIIGSLVALCGALVVISHFYDFSTIIPGASILFLGLMIFFISRIRTDSPPVSNGRMTEAVIGIFIGIIAVLLGIVGVANLDYISFGIPTIIEGIVIAWFSRIRGVPVVK
jgi:serine/threonine protein kinase